VSGERQLSIFDRIKQGLGGPAVRIHALFIAGFLTASLINDTIAAPSQLYGKSVIISWSEEREQKIQGRQDLFHASRQVAFSLYISSVGRVFNRLAVSGGGRRGASLSGSSDQVAGMGSDQGKRHVSFQGRSLIVTAQQVSGARRIAANFDDGFTSCTASVIRAKEVGASKIVSQSTLSPGMVVEIYSIRISQPTCSIKNGNVFAGE
jgi:hypothetical protein